MTIAINLAELPDPDVIETLDLESIIAEYKADFVMRYPESASVINLESEPIVKLIEVSAYRELILRARYNDEARALILAKAKGSDLDHIAFTYYRQEQRLVITEENLESDPPVAAVLESDDDFRNRVSLKPESYSTAGPTGAYIFHALSAHGQVLDASCDSPEPGISRITVLSREAEGIPTSEITDAVEARLNTTEVRPLCEEINVQPASIITYQIDCQLYVDTGPDNSLVLADAEATLSSYTKSLHRLGKNVPISGLHAAAQRPGVQRNVITITGAALVDEEIQVDKQHAAYCSNITISIVGIVA